MFKLDLEKAEETLFSWASKSLQMVTAAMKWKDADYSSEGKESACNEEDLSSIPGSERASGEGNGYSVQYSCLDNPTDREAWQATNHGVTESDTTEWLSSSHVYFIICIDILQYPFPHLHDSNALM